MEEFDYDKLGLKCGLEIHQQLDTKQKLFCRCPSTLQGKRKPDFSVSRTMRPVLGELGTFDKAMLTEYEKDIDIIYEGYNDVICTYELDDSPPYECNPEAISVAIEIALMLNVNIIEEMHVCRKNYLDGSVPCGFQRTMILGTDGSILLENKKSIGIDILSLEEDACRKSKTQNKTNFYRLDRLGIPLVEVTTKPDINHPLECRDCAERIGLLLWSSNVKRVLGSIRQDINVSIKKGTRVEIKGVQKLDWIPLLIDNEIKRQLGLINIKQEIIARKINLNDFHGKIMELSTILKNTKAKFIQKGLKKKEEVVGINFKGFRDIFGLELSKNYRFGTEVSSKVKSISGLQGIIHSDEDLRKHNFSQKEISMLKRELNQEENDCFVLVLGNITKAHKALKVVIDRVKQAFEGVPPETRRALESGNTEFLRELHGGARLYPDTDTPAIIIKEQQVEQIKKTLPPYPWEIIENYSKKFKVEPRLIKDLIFEQKLKLFEDITKVYPKNPSLILTTLLETTTALRREGKAIDNIKSEDFKKIFFELKQGRISKEIIEEIMIIKADNPSSKIEEIIKDLNIEHISLDDLKLTIIDIVEKNIQLVQNKQMHAMGPLMGEIMKQVKGSIDGAIVSKELKRILSVKLKEMN